MARYQPRHRRSNALARFFLGATVFVTLLLVTLVVFRTSVIELALSSALGQQGFAPAEINVVRADFSGFQIKSGVLAGGALSFSEAKLSYSWTSLRDQRFHELRLNGLRINGAWTEEGVSFGLFDEMNESTSETAISSNDGDGSAVKGERLPFDNLIIEDAYIVLAHPDGQIQATANANLAASTSPVTVNAAITLIGPSLSGEVNWQGDVALGDILKSSLAGNINLLAEGFRVPGLDQPITTNIQVEALAQDGVLSISSDQDLEISGPWPEFLSPFGLETPKDQTFNLSLGTSSQTAPFFHIRPDQSGLRSMINFDLNWVTPFGRGDLNAAGWASMDKDGLPQNFKFERLAVRIDGVQTPSGTIWGSLVADGLSGPLAIAGGPVKITGRIQEGFIKTASFKEIDLSADTDFRLDGLSLAFSLNDLTAQIDGLTYGDTIKLMAPLKVGLSESRSAYQTATLVFGADGSATATLDTDLNLSIPDLDIRTKNSVLSFVADIPSLWIEGYWVSTDGALDMRAAIRDAQIQSDSATVSDIELDVSGGLDSFTGPFSAILRKSTPRAAERSGVIIGGRLAFDNNNIISEGVMNLSSDIKLGDFQVQYDVNTQSGRIASTVGPLVFGGQGLTPADLAPLALPFTPTSGEFAARAVFPFGIQPEGSQSGTLYLKDLEIEGGYYRISRLNTAIALESIWPP
ncbi:MAG: hypothetical protein GKS03_10230 [Alphaproteobacteria bacterium]|nr:hypothetical protein [Alphaproteobacteria bacterium]